jgi:hypothetical protein
MSLKGKATAGGGDFALCPAGNHAGCLIGVVDLGTHLDSFQGQTERKVRRVLLVWEVECEVDGKDQHLVVGRDYNIGLNDKGELVYGQKSALRQLLEGFRGKQFGEGEDIDPEALLGKACLVQVTHEKTKGTGKDIARVKSIAKPLKNMAAIKPAHPKFSYAGLRGGVATLRRLAAARLRRDGGGRPQALPRVGRQRPPLDPRQQSAAAQRRADSLLTPQVHRARPRWPGL